MTPLGAGLAISVSLGASALGIGLLADAAMNAASQVPVVQWPQLTGTAGIVAMLGYAVTYLVKRNEKLEALLESKNGELLAKSVEFSEATKALADATNAMKSQSEHQCNMIQGMLITQRRFMDVLATRHGFKIGTEDEELKFNHQPNDPSRRKQGV
jgi:F0F1-type ATP synthase membrane subunit c/vacuolar-type H+-ATPase subunit K